jgi:hypothetical protein
MTRTRIQLAAAFLLTLLAPLGGCTGDDNGAGASSSPPRATPETSSSSTTPAPASSTTELPATTSSTTTSPTAPPTTVDPITASKAAVVAAVAQSRQVYNYVVANYDAPDALDVLATTAVRDGPSWNVAVQNMATLRSNGWLVRPNPEIPDTSTVEGDVQLLDGPPATRAQATVCTISAGIVYKPGAAPDGSDVIINDEVVARRELVTMVLQDGAWKLEQGTNVGTWKGQATCPAA